MIEGELKEFLDKKVAQYEKPDFIKDDPICVPHRFSKKQDIEIAGFFAAILAWGNRKSIISSCNRLLAGMDHAPYDFIRNFEEQDLKPFLGFAHRTFNATDLFHFLDFLQYHYKTSGALSLETAFSKYLKKNDSDTEPALVSFYNSFFDEDIFPDYPKRTRKHIATPFKKSACKRLNMFLRWMVRSNTKGVDFGIWKTIKPSQLVCPLDVHVARVAKHFNLLQRPGNDWLAAKELTQNLKLLDAKDPVKYDFALFGLGVVEKF
ncbi:TIGR02757 family protein [Niabella sp. 22666]|uniref:TIGR02757 family protein n=1 Tax=Niabella sp. 22666 TaxID=3453954 RepID=UPI003F8426B4